MIQEDLRHRRIDCPLPELTNETLIAGCDIAYAKGSDLCFAAVVLTRDFGATVIEEAHAELTVSFPYVPGLLSFREVPALLEAFAQLSQRPEIVVCDGQGLAHPRRFGLACHLGLWLDLPTVGCAKSRFIGTHAPITPEVWTTPLMDNDEVIGELVRRVDGVKPVYVSPGHRCDQASASALIRAGADGYRVPEPVRQADLLTYTLRRAFEAK